MALKDLFKKIKKRKTEKKPEVKIKPVSKEKEVLGSVPKPKKKGSPVYGIVKGPHISEKATNSGMLDRYVFKVFPRANKNEIKKAIESIYGVNVLAVNIVNMPHKKRRLGRTVGFKKGYKKAVVKIKQGQKIEII